MKTRYLLLFVLAGVCSCQSEKEQLVCDATDQTIDIKKENAKKVALDFAMDLRRSTRSGDVKEVGDVYVWKKGDALLTRSVDDNGLSSDTIAYIVNFEDDGGYVILPPDNPDGMVYAYIEEGHLMPGDSIDCPGFQTFLNGLAYVNIPGSSLNDTLTTQGPENPGIPNPGNWNPTIVVANDSVFTPLMTTKWGQEEPFNTYCFTLNGLQAMAGCVAIAGAQVIAYHQYPSSFNGHNYVWSEICGGCVPTSTVGMESVAHLVQDIGGLVNMEYGTDESGAQTYDLINCWQQFGYNYSFSSDYNFNRCVQNFQAGRPVIIDGMDVPSLSRHCWVLDGSLIRKTYVKQLDENFQQMLVLVGSEKMVHCNWGWYGKYNGYFLFDSLSLQNKKLNDDLSVFNGYVPDDYNFSVFNRCFYDIYPNE